MSKQWRWTLAAVAACLLAVAISWADADAFGTVELTRASQADPSELLDLSVGFDDAEPLRVTLTSDDVLAYESFVLDGPHRVVIDLTGAVSRLDRYSFPVGRDGVSRVRAAQHAMEPVPVTRVVFDLEEPLPYRIDQDAGALTVQFGESDEPAPIAQVWQPEPEPAEPAPIAQARQPEPKPAEPAPAAPPVDDPEPEISRPDVYVEPPVVEELPADEPIVEAIREQPEIQPVAVAARPVKAEPKAPAKARDTEPAPAEERSVEPDVIERLLNAPAFAAPQESDSGATNGRSFESRTIVTDEVVYTGKRISLNLRDADIKEVFRLFHEISGLNFVLDPGVSGRVTIVLDQVPWDQALDLILKNNGLDKILEQNVLRIATTQKLAQEAASRKQLRDAKELEVEPITLTRTLSYAKAKDVEKVIREGGVLSQRGRVIVDERTNTLIISDVPKKVDPLDTLISTLDSETTQVMIEARIVETSREFGQDLGVDWGFTALADASRGTATGLSFPHNASARYGLNLPGAGSASNLAFSFGNVIDSFTLDLALNTIETEGRGRILSSPKVATQNNERAEIEQGVRIPIVNTTATEINVEFVSASLRLVVTPQITAEGTIILDIEVENNSPDFFNTAGGIPSIRTQRAQTKVMINDGGTTVIGGIFTVNEGESEIGVPWFRKIPVFGWLFRTRSVTTENRELLIFITSKIVKLS